MPSPFDSFRSARWIRTINLILHAILILTLVGGLNYIARNHPNPLRRDLTRYRRFSLSPETLSYINNLHQPVHVVVTQATDDTDSPELRGLLQEYKIATEANPDGRIDVRYIDIYQNRREAEQLGIEQAGIIVLQSGDRSRAVPIDDLYKAHRVPDKNTNVPGATVIERTAFQGEQALTAAILDVSNPERKKIYFLTGHGELNPLDTDAARGLSDARNQLRVRNFDVETLDLVANRGVRLDANLIISTAPQSRFTSQEQEWLRTYLGNGAGRLVLFLGPGMRAEQLGLSELLLDDWGIQVDDDLILDKAPGSMTEDGDLLIYSFLPHPVTQALLNHRVDPLRLGPTRSVRPFLGRPPGNGVSTVTLAVSSLTAWGRGYRDGPADYLPNSVDIRPPLPGSDPKVGLGVVVAAERIAPRPGLAFSVRGGRVVVVGNGDLITNKRIPDVGNLNLFLGAVNWTVDRDTQLSIPARPIERFQLSISAGDLTKLRYALLFGVPGVAAFLGLMVYWTRRH